MLRINQIKLPCDHEKNALRMQILKKLHVSDSELLSLQIVKRSIDARKKPDIYYVYTVDVSLSCEKKILKTGRHKNIMYTKSVEYKLPTTCEISSNTMRPIIVGFGPAGLFAAYYLASCHLNPLVIERGAPVDLRIKEVEKFWNTGVLNPDSNVQFGEGGAGTFSDGKLNTGVKDPKGRNRFVLETFVQFGAPPEILYEQKPHIGTDLLTSIVKKMRETIISLGGEIRFHTQFTGYKKSKNGINQVLLSKRSSDEQETHYVLNATCLILAIGHSARDTFSMLQKMALPMVAKAFAVGLRVQHPQVQIQKAQYGVVAMPFLPPAPYKLTGKSKSGRGVYSFCMCPGGYVVNASSAKGFLAINGMSFHDRGSENANAAIVVTVSPEDYNSSHALSGMEFQMELERHAYEAGNGKIPVQRYEDFKKNQISKTIGEMTPCFKGSYELANVRNILPEFINLAFIDGMEQFGKHIEGFASPDVLLAGVESRTSSPVRILRNDQMESTVSGIYPCGEGAGYAGGIVSAAIDGLKVAEAVFSSTKN